MLLSADQCEALQKGSPVPVKLDGVECVILRKDLYQRLKDTIYDDAEPDPRDAYPAVLTAWDEDDNPDDYKSYQ